MKRRCHSPLNYTGSKYRLVKRIMGLVPQETQAIVSPFMRGGVVEKHRLDQQRQLL